MIFEERTNNFFDTVEDVSCWLYNIPISLIQQSILEEIPIEIFDTFSGKTVGIYRLKLLLLPGEKPDIILDEFREENQEDF